MRAHRRDLNQSATVRALRDAGATVVITADVGGGFPDLVVGWRGKTYLVEVKNLTQLSEKQLEFIERWRGGPVIVLRTVDDVVRFLQEEGDAR
jgi:Holliday junction resolvase